MRSERATPPAGSFFSFASARHRICTTGSASFDNGNTRCTMLTAGEFFCSQQNTDSPACANA
jgi:hypothetical protein